MGKSKKRRRDKSSSSDASPDRVKSKDLLKRLKRLERELKNRPRSGSRSRSTSRRSRSRHRSRAETTARRYRSRSGSRSTQSCTMTEKNNELGDCGRACSRSPSSPLIRRQSPCAAETTPTGRPVDACSVYEPSDELVLHVDESLSDEVLEILGDNPEENRKTTFSLHEALNARWRHNLINGLTKDTALALLAKYEVPNNLPILSPPKLNSEISQILDKTSQMRDGSYVELQNQLGKGLSALGKGINILLPNVGGIPTEVRQNLLPCMTNLFHRVSITRRNLLNPLFNKNVKDQLANCPPNEFLFGTDIGEKIKFAKSLENVGKDLKPQKNSGSSASRKPLTWIGNQQRSYVRCAENLNAQRPARRVGETRASKGQQPSRRTRWENRRQSKDNQGYRHRGRD